MSESWRLYYRSNGRIHALAPRHMEEYKEYSYIEISNQLAERLNDDLRISQFRVQQRDGIPQLFQIRASQEGVQEIGIEQLEQETFQQQEPGIWGEWRTGGDNTPIEIIQQNKIVKVRNHAYPSEKHVFYVVRKGYWEWPIATINLPSKQAEAVGKVNTANVEVICHTLPYKQVNFRKQQ